MPVVRQFRELAERISGYIIPDVWHVVPVLRGKEFAGFFIVRDNEIHAYRVDEYKGNWLTRQDVERLTKPLFERFGHIVTTVRKDNLQGHRFVQRLGFHATREDDKLVYYKAERLRHARL